MQVCYEWSKWELSLPLTRAALGGGGYSTPAVFSRYFKNDSRYRRKFFRGDPPYRKPLRSCDRTKLNRSIFRRDPLNRKLRIYVSCTANGVLTIKLYESSRSIGRPIVAMFYPLLILTRKEGRIWMFINWIQIPKCCKFIKEHLSVDPMSIFATAAPL